MTIRRGSAAVPAVAYKELRGRDDGVSSAEIRERVVAARAVQQSRGQYNARIPVRSLRKVCALDDEEFSTRVSLLWVQ